jgi:hypothetical protein
MLRPGGEKQERFSAKRLHSQTVRTSSSARHIQSTTSSTRDCSKAESFRLRSNSFDRNSVDNNSSVGSEDSFRSHSSSVQICANLRSCANSLSSSCVRHTSRLHQSRLHQSHHSSRRGSRSSRVFKNEKRSPSEKVYRKKSEIIYDFRPTQQDQEIIDQHTSFDQPISNGVTNLNLVSTNLSQQQIQNTQQHSLIPKTCFNVRLTVATKIFYAKF